LIDAWVFLADGSLTNEIPASIPSSENNITNKSIERECTTFPKFRRSIRDIRSESWELATNTQSRSSPSTGMPGRS
jgi:hypothetical protein